MAAAAITQEAVLARHRTDVASALGGRVAVCQAVAKLHRAEPHSAAWSDSALSGLLVYAIDKRSPNVQTLSLFALGPPFHLAFEAQLFYELRFDATSMPAFYAFELDGCIVGVRFTKAEDGNRFATMMQQMRPKPVSLPPASAGTPQAALGCSAASPLSNAGETLLELGKAIGGAIRWFGGSGKAEDAQTAEEEVVMQIGGPTNVRHISHVGFTADGGFEARNLPPEWKELFKHARIRPRELDDPVTSRLIFQTILDQLAHSRSELPSARSTPGRLPQTPTLSPPPPPTHTPFSGASGYSSGVSPAQPPSSSRFASGCGRSCASPALQSHASGRTHSQPPEWTALRAPMQPGAVTL